LVKNGFEVWLAAPAAAKNGLCDCYFAMKGLFVSTLAATTNVYFGGSIKATGFLDDSFFLEVSSVDGDYFRLLVLSGLFSSLVAF